MALVLTVAGMTSCSQDILPTDEPTDTENMKMKLVMSHPAQKVDAAATDFEEGDKVGIFVTQADKPLQLGGNVVNNEAMTFSGNGWTAARTLYWDDGTYNVYAYYPDYAFSDCPLTDIYVDAQLPPVCNAKTFATEGTGIFGTCRVHVPKGRVNIYKASDGWKLFKNIITD